MAGGAQRSLSSARRQAAEAAAKADAAVKYKEQLWTAADWEAHMTFRRYLPQPAILLQVSVHLAPIVLWTVLVAACVGLYATFAEPAGAPRITGHSSQLMVPVTVTSFALSLLLVFKTNNSFARWWDCNCLWGSVFQKMTDFQRMATAFVGRTNPELMPALRAWTIAFMPAMAAQLRKQDFFIWIHLGDVLSGPDLEWLSSCPMPATGVLQVLSRLLDQAQLDSVQRWNLEEQICQMSFVAGKITQFTWRFLFIFLSYLAFPFWDLLGWWSLPVLGTVTFLLAGIENVGNHIENPLVAMPINTYTSLLIKILRGLPAVSEQAAAIAAKAAQAGGPAALAGSPPSGSIPGAANGKLLGKEDVDLEAGAAG